MVVIALNRSEHVLEYSRAGFALQSASDHNTSALMRPSVMISAIEVSDTATRCFAFAVAVMYILLYALLQKKKLPKGLWLPLTKCYFYPMLVPSYLWRRLCVRGSYFSQVDDCLLLGAVPIACFGHVRQLHRMRVRAVVNMCAEYGGPVAAYASLTPPIKQLHLPVTDHFEPTVDQLKAAVAFITEHARNGGKVLVHCKGGHGRGAAVAFAYLVSEAGGSLTLEDAQAQLNSVRHVRKKLYQQPVLVSFSRLTATGGRSARELL